MTTATQQPALARPIPFGQPMLDEAEKQAVMRVLDGPILTHGPLVKQFEADFAAFTGAEHAVATSSCAAALHLACLALDIGPGDEVLVSAQTHVATAHAVELVGATCRFVDSEPRTGNVDPAVIESAVTERTKAIALVHYLGFPAAMDRIMALAERYGLAVIEDCAIALGTTFHDRHVGLIGDAGCFSFYPVKAMTTGEGGMLITRRDDVAARASQLRAFGIDRNVVAERPVPGLYDVQMLGLNYRMNEIGAALGIAQLGKLPEFLRVRRRNFRALADGLSGIDGVEVLGKDEPLDTAGCYCLVMMLDDALAARRADLIDLLKARGVGTSIYYPQPVPRMSYYRTKYDTRDADTPVAARISDASLAFPVGPHVGPDDVTNMITIIAGAVEEIRHT